MIVVWINRAILFLVGMTMLMADVTILPKVTVNKAVTGLLIASAGLMMALRPARLPRNTKTLWVLAFAFGLMLSAAYSALSGAPSYLLWVGQSFVLVTAFYFLLLLSLRSLEDLRALLWGVVLSATATSVSVLASFETVGSLGTPERSGGIAGDPNFFALGASIAPAIALFLAVRSKSIGVKILLAVVSAVIFAGALMSLSRGAYVALAAMFGVFVVRFVKLNLKSIVLPATVLLCLSPLFLPDRVFDRVGTLGQNWARENSIQNRLQGYSRGLDMFLSSPILGVGIGRSHLSTRRGGAIDPWDLRGRSYKPGGEFLVIHSTYVVFAAETGLLGLVPFLVIILLSWLDFSRVWSLRKHRDFAGDRTLQELVYLAGTLQIALAGLAVGGLFLNATRFKAFWMVFALGTVVLNLARRHIAWVETRDAPVSPVPRAGVPSLNRQPSAGSS